ncbi:hypothetical protein M408DRAFT_30052 [Serendipita vermifera MAFF 305830]|uniref:F-box domain-containing protein n=1 Tax=Serendipita vermifera MAFF 305830 TaxID=933852 RepID=A0A0C2W2X9_SERVB|nr:hypothetical protein M408DRAFT_30052 [Serendipita vermifera MAFF 305830]
MFLQPMTARSASSDPPEIRRKLEALKHQHEIIGKLRSRMTAAQLECTRLETEIFHYRASVAPIRKCPQELLLLFFEYYTCENPRLIRRLLLVCKEWYELAISSPRLWNRIPIKFDSSWDIESTCEFIKKRLDKCLELSGILPLELNLEFGELIPAQAQIVSQIRENLLGYTHLEGQDIVNDWIDGLDLDSFIDPEIIGPHQSHHLVDLLGTLIGDYGNKMLCWASLRLELPEDSELAIEILEPFSHLTPNLTRLQITCDGDMHGIFDSLIETVFPDLSALQHLEVPSEEELELFKFNPTLIQSLTFSGMYSCDPSILTPFTRLQQLDVQSVILSSYEQEDSFSAIHLPGLRRLLVRGYIPNFDTLEFRVPVLDKLQLSRGYVHSPLTYPKVQASRIGWEVERKWAPPWKPDRVQLDLRAILFQYRGATELQIPSHFKKVVSTLVRKLKSDSTWQSALRLINLEAEDGTISETMKVQEL